MKKTGKNRLGIFYNFIAVLVVLCAVELFFNMFNIESDFIKTLLNIIGIYSSLSLVDLIRNYKK